MSLLSAAPSNGESGRGRGRPPCKTARAKKRPARKRSSNRPGAQFFHVPKIREKDFEDLVQWTHEFWVFWLTWQVNCALRLSDGTQPSRPSAFWPTGRGISILTNSSMIDETDMGNHTHQHHRSRGSIPIISVHTLLTNILLSCCSCPLPGRRCCYHHLDDANQIGIKNCKQKRSVLAKLFFHGRIFTLWFPESPPKILW